MNPAEKTIKLVDRFQRRFPWLAFPVAVWKKFGDDQAGNLRRPGGLLRVRVDLPAAAGPVHGAGDRAARSFRSARRTGRRRGEELRGLGSSLTQQHPLLQWDRPGAGHWGLADVSWARAGVANAMQNALNSVWEVPKADRPGFPWSWLRSFGLILVVGLAEIATSVLSSFIISRGHLLPGFAITVLATIVTLLFNIGLFWLAFRLAAAKTITWRELRLGAILGGIVWQILQLVGGYYIGHQLRHSTVPVRSTFSDRAGSHRLAVPAGRGHARTSRKPTSSGSAGCGRAAWRRPRTPKKMSARTSYTLKPRRATRTRPSAWRFRLPGSPGEEKAPASSPAAAEKPAGPKPHGPKPPDRTGEVHCFRETGAGRGPS